LQSYDSTHVFILLHNAHETTLLKGRSDIRINGSGSLFQLLFVYM